MGPDDYGFHETGRSATGKCKMIEDKIITERNLRVGKDSGEFLTMGLVQPILCACE
jgi:hypothetical protein